MGLGTAETAGLTRGHSLKELFVPVMAPKALKQTPFTQLFTLSV